MIFESLLRAFWGLFINENLSALESALWLNDRIFVGKFEHLKFMNNVKIANVFLNDRKTNYFSHGFVVFM